ncbi:hypothetical protein BESB_074120 [Besnoitia besnoiti]|uniref:DNA-directed RNA polymerase insert domain-containing protein n=1 Tax=Besnoitia besnoiti TaxID=94643 RepID=A0A2A9MFV5_BESBE|nr:uncharacterized protein BESB_074120 [Besnoitia besnoiti]PFH34260.1 hypothetical protein BESB_074120 [Besnoitia besnoiti]
MFFSPTPSVLLHLPPSPFVFFLTAHAARFGSLGVSNLRDATLASFSSHFSSSYNFSPAFSRFSSSPSGPLAFALSPAPLAPAASPSSTLPPHVPSLPCLPLGVGFASSPASAVLCPTCMSARRRRSPAPCRDSAVFLAHAAPSGPYAMRGVASRCGAFRRARKGAPFVLNSFLSLDSRGAAHSPCPAFSRAASAARPHSSRSRAAFGLSSRPTPAAAGARLNISAGASSCFASLPLSFESSAGGHAEEAGDDLLFVLESASPESLPLPSPTCSEPFAFYSSSSAAAPSLPEAASSTPETASQPASPVSAFALNELERYYAAARRRGDLPALPGHPSTASPFPSSSSDSSRASRTAAAATPHAPPPPSADAPLPGAAPPRALGEGEAASDAGPREETLHRPAAAGGHSGEGEAAPPQREKLAPTTLYHRGPRIPHVELHPRNLTGAPASELSPDEKRYLWRHGYFAGDHFNQTDTWKNWHLLNRGTRAEVRRRSESLSRTGAASPAPRGSAAVASSARQAARDLPGGVRGALGFTLRHVADPFRVGVSEPARRWRDPGVQQLPTVETLRGKEEPAFHRVPLQYWDEARGLSYDIRHYPIYEEFYNSTTLDPAIYTPKYNLTLLPFTPAFVPRRDRMGLLYGDARMFDTWPSWDKDFKLRVEEGTNVTVIPETGHLYQKLYVGPIPVTTGWTMGSLIKAFAAQRCPGHAIVAVKLHADSPAEAERGKGKPACARDEAHGAASRRDEPMVTQLPNVREDLLEISLNLKGVAFETLVPGESACVRVRAVGPQLLVAGMVDWPSFVRVANPEHFIAKVEEGGVLDLEVKLEWGRGAWLADLFGLYREEEGVDTRCYKRRRIWEVDHRGFYPTSCIFGACTMMRLAVHKLMGTRFCQDRQVSTNPTEQLVVEIWTDASKSPKEVLAFALQDMLAWFVELRRQLVRDVDWKTEDEDLEATWKHVAAWNEAKALQERLGGPPLMVWENPAQNMTLAEGEKSFAMPEFRPPPCSVHPVAWLKRELATAPYAADGYSEASRAPSRRPRKRKRAAANCDDSADEGDAARDTRKCGGLRGKRRAQEASDSDTDTPGDRAEVAEEDEEREEQRPSDVLLSSVQGITPRALQALHAFGISTLEDVRHYTAKQLKKIPNIGDATVSLLASTLSTRFNASLAEAYAAATAECLVEPPEVGLGVRRPQQPPPPPPADLQPVGARRCLVGVENGINFFSLITHGNSVFETDLRAGDGRRDGSSTEEGRDRSERA